LVLLHFHFLQFNRFCVPVMEGGDDDDVNDFEREEEEEEVSEETELLKDRFRLSAITIAESEAKKNNMEVSQPVIACIADLAFQFTVGEGPRAIRATRRAQVCEHGGRHTFCS
ncbi:hypothetical protein AQUCO_04000072v1, partial [Aquilegia coerulea]